MSSNNLEASPTPATPSKILWYRSTWFAATVLGLCNLAAPGIWGAMNSLGAGGQATPYLTNTSNALTFCLMVLTAFLTSAIVRYIGVKWTLFFGAAGYAPYAAGLYCNNVFNNTWFILLGAALCGISAGTFWAIEAAIALSYPEPENQGRFLGWWLSFRVGGQILGGAVNLGINANRSGAGKVNPKVYLVFIAIQAVGPFLAFFLPSPKKVQRTDGLPVRLFVTTGLLHEIKAAGRLFFTKRFLLIVPLIVCTVFPESYSYTYTALAFSVRGRALGSFLSGVVAIVAGNLLGFLLDRKNISLKTRARAAFFIAMGLQGCWWVWSTIITKQLHDSGRTYDWSDEGFGKAFALYLFLVTGFQLNYLYLYFVCGTLVEEPADIIRIGGLLRATESAAQAVSYGLNAIESFGLIGASALNFALWGVAVIPAWLVIKEIGVTYWGRGEKETREAETLVYGTHAVEKGSEGTLPGSPHSEKA
ncbi:major facilitator superfamily domain-containing protein [Leucosporidium creatinivorum]|uniref:Major facilitator superfamily domain-containing protein n=1 Tax=Leucosporidium creatinivorum TaxID=106004 RepID=A0A1Y2G4V7_9BASI|nr:major facilitator superfamily domain-containing protein [Leucosporidium creatinivorum]